MSTAAFSNISNFASRHMSAKGNTAAKPKPKPKPMPMPKPNPRTGPYKSASVEETLALEDADLSGSIQISSSSSSSSSSLSPSDAAAINAGPGARPCQPSCSTEDRAPDMAVPPHNGTRSSIIRHEIAKKKQILAGMKKTQEAHSYGKAQSSRHILGRFHFKRGGYTKKAMKACAEEQSRVQASIEELELEQRKLESAFDVDDSIAISSVAISKKGFGEDPVKHMTIRGLSKKLDTHRSAKLAAMQAMEQYRGNNQARFDAKGFCIEEDQQIKFIEMQIAILVKEGADKVEESDSSRKAKIIAELKGRMNHEDRNFKGMQKALGNFTGQDEDLVDDLGRQMLESLQKTRIYRKALKLMTQEAMFHHVPSTPSKSRQPTEPMTPRRKSIQAITQMQMNLHAITGSLRLSIKSAEGLDLCAEEQLTETERNLLTLATSKASRKKMAKNKFYVVIKLDGKEVGRTKEHKQDFTFPFWNYESEFKLDGAKQISLFFYCSEHIMSGVCHLKLEDYISSKMSGERYVDVFPKGRVNLGLFYSNIKLTTKKKLAREIGVPTIRNRNNFGGSKKAAASCNKSSKQSKDVSTAQWLSLKKFEHKKEENRRRSELHAPSGQDLRVSMFDTSEGSPSAHPLSSKSVHFHDGYDSSADHSPAAFRFPPLDAISEQPAAPVTTTRIVNPSVRASMDNYELISVLGRGHFGKVLLANYKLTKGDLVAIKCVKKENAIVRDEVPSLMTERNVFEAVSNSRHPFLVSMHSTFQTEQYLCFVMEYAPGGDMMIHIQSQVFNEYRTAFSAGCVLLGLEFLHSKDIVYRDLKLDNILMDAEGYIKIADYGLCRLETDSDSRCSTFCGTPEFMAPEMLCENTYTRAVDWWAFGVLIYEMLIGEPPFPGDEEDEIFDNIVNTEPHMPYDMNTSTLRILRQLLEKTPERRLGWGDDDAEPIKAHSFFKKIDFERLYARQVPPPFVPSVRSKTDVSNFDPEFTTEEVQLTPMNAHLTDAHQDLFKGFSCNCERETFI